MYLCTNTPTFSCMEGGEKTKKRPLDLDWETLLPSRDEEPPPVLVVKTSTTATEQPQSSTTGGGGEQRDDILRMSDTELNDAIGRHRCNIENMGHRLPDKGEKLKVSLKRLEDEKERRKDHLMQMNDDGCKNATQAQNPRIIGPSYGFRQGVPSSLPRSQFASRFCEKLEENSDCRTVNAFEKEISHFNPCDHRRMKVNGQFSTKERHKNGLSLRQTSFQCPSTLSVDVDKEILSNGGQKGRHSSTCSPRPVEEDLPSCFSRRNASHVPDSNNLRPRNGQTVVLVDEEEPQLIETIQQDKVDDCPKDIKIYYPSRDDPESVEICYTDMECLAPEAYLSSTIMNFYIQYLQQRTYPTDRARCDYHFFNTYFYKKLKEAVLNKRSDKETLFVKFRRWWKGVNIFEKAYILLPIHENLHWSLVIICIPDKEDESGPIMLHLDSLGLHNSESIFNNVKSFLKEEWNYLNQEEATSDLPIADKIWKNLPRRIDQKKIPVPQQKNEYDCGLFVLFFMERFIKEAPERLRKKDLAMFGKLWFKPEDASGLRSKIPILLRKEFKNASEHRSVLDL